MKILVNLFLAVFIKPFYKENAGVIAFIYTMMFFVVSTVDGAGMFAYHYSLVSSMLASPFVYCLVLFLWFLYARKCMVFVSDIIRSPQHSFLYIINSISAKKRLFLFLFTNAFLLLPVLLDDLFIMYAGCHQQAYLATAFVVFYLLLLCIAMAATHVRVLNNPHRNARVLPKKTHARFGFSSRYPFVLLSFIANEHKAIWIGVKIYSCGVLYLITRYNTTTDYDTLIAFLFFNFGILSNGVLVYLTRQFEESSLTFYRSLPVPLSKRFANYVLLYAVLLLPELITAFSLLPVHLHSIDAASFVLCACSLLLLMNSLLFLSDFSTKEFAVVLVGVFCVQYILIPTAGYLFLSILFFIAAVLLFFTGYYRFERNMEKESI